MRASLAFNSIVLSAAYGLAEAVCATCFVADSGQHVMQCRLPDLSARHWVCTREAISARM